MTLTHQKKKRTTIHDRRRAGRHHKQTPDYTKPYWPYLPIGIIIGLGMLMNSFWGVIQQAVLGYATNTTISGLLEETNAQRSGGGIGGLALNSKLNAAAQAKANDMAARNYWSHNTPDGSPPWTFFSAAGYDYTAAGENLAYGFDNSNTTVVAWMNSPGHRANIMNATFTEVGFGIANVTNYQEAGEQTIVVAMYGTPVAAVPVAAQAPKQQQTAPTTAEPAAPASQSQTESTPPAATPLETNQTPEVATTETQSEIAPTSKRVARLQLFTDESASWTMFALSALAAVAIAALFLRHGLLWRRVLVKGETFVLRHRFFDVVLVLVGVLGFILTRTAGTIH